jgi:hypothetical protein
MILAADPTGFEQGVHRQQPRAFSPNLAGVPSSHYNWRSDDGCNSWRSASQGDGITDSLHTDDHAWAFGPDGSLYSSNDGGVWRSTDDSNS